MLCAKKILHPAKDWLIITYYQAQQWRRYILPQLSQIIGAITFVKKKKKEKKKRKSSHCSGDIWTFKAAEHAGIKASCNVPDKHNTKTYSYQSYFILFYFFEKVFLSKLMVRLNFFAFCFCWETGAIKLKPTIVATIHRES